MRESAMRQMIVTLLRPLDAIAVENPCRPGTPDINFIEGWVELKVLERWPVRAGTPVTIPCFTQQQRVWLTRRWAAGGNCWLLVRIGDDWILLDGHKAADVIGRLGKQALIKVADLYCEGALDKAALYKKLKAARL